MRGDQLARRAGIIRATEARPKGLAVTAIVQREEPEIRTIYPDLGGLQVPGFPLYTQKIERANRHAFIDAFKLRIFPSFTLNHFVLGSVKILSVTAERLPLDEISHTLMTLAGYLTV